jgi:hypothetical protein
MEILGGLADGADHVDVKTVEGDVTLREFLSQMLAYQPAWVTALYGVRKGFVWLLGMKQEGIPVAPRFTPESVPMTVGEKAAFFTVRRAEEERVWVADVAESHLRAALAVVKEGRSFHVITVVHYKSWAGPVYFNVIRPFHHLVVKAMARAGAQSLRHMSR